MIQYVYLGLEKVGNSGTTFPGNVHVRGKLAGKKEKRKKEGKKRKKEKKKKRKKKEKGFGQKCENNVSSNLVIYS